MQHKTLNPSSAARRMLCPGSFKLESLRPDTEKSPAALEGDAAHWVATSQLIGLVIAEGETAPNGEKVTAEMIEGAHLYKDYISKTVGFHNLHIEEKLHIPSIHPDCWGTPDCWHYTAHNASKRGALHVVDYKFGHTNVEAYENWQLIEYAAGILELLQINGLIDGYIDVFLTIVQPRGSYSGTPIRTWATTARALRPYFNKAHGAEALAATDGTSCYVSSQCYHCSARAFCPALQQSALTTVDLAGESTPFDLPPESVGSELRFLLRAKKLLEARATALQEQAFALLQRGTRVPYFELEETAGREDWAKSIEEILILEDIYKIKLQKEIKLITPKQAIKAGLPAELVRNYSEKKSGGLRLVPCEKVSKNFNTTTDK